MATFTVPPTSTSDGVEVSEADSRQGVKRPNPSEGPILLAKKHKEDKSSPPSSAASISVTPSAALTTAPPTRAPALGPSPLQVCTYFCLLFANFSRT
jgi:hypothetical protein